MPLDNDPKWKYRSIRDKNTSIVKRHARETAARLVFSGNYEYADDGPYDPDQIDAGWMKRVTQPPQAQQITIESRLKFADPKPVRRRGASSLVTPAGEAPVQRPAVQQPAASDDGFQMKASPETARQAAKAAATPAQPKRTIDMSKLTPDQRGRLAAHKATPSSGRPPPPAQAVTEGVNSLRQMIDAKRAERDAGK